MIFFFFSSGFVVWEVLSSDMCLVCQQKGRNAMIMLKLQKTHMIHISVLWIQNLSLLSQKLLAEVLFLFFQSIRYDLIYGTLIINLSTVCFNNIVDVLCFTEFNPNNSMQVIWRLYFAILLKITQIETIHTNWRTLFFSLMIMI